MKIVARHLSPTEAHLLQSCLQAAHVQSEVVDVNTVQAYGLLAPALGGASIRVEDTDEAEALQVIAAFNDGVFCLDDDFDPGLAS